MENVTRSNFYIGDTYINRAYDPSFDSTSGAIHDVEEIEEGIDQRQKSDNKINCCKNCLNCLQDKIEKIPFFPGWSRIMRLITLWIMIISVWCLAYFLIGSAVLPPNGGLFQLILLSVLAKIGGWIAVQIRLPGLLGMLLVGIGLQIAGVVNVDDPTYQGLIRFIRKSSLVIIMMRAGLDLDPAAVKKLKFTILRLGWMPWALEACFVALISAYLFNLSIGWAIILGAVEAAVSPAVVVPSLIILRSKGFGIIKGVPTLVLAVTGIEDAVAIAAYGVTATVMFSTDLVISIVKGPGAVLLGIGAGVFLGILCRLIPYHKDPYLISLRTIYLLVGGLIVVLGSSAIAMDGAGPLAVIIAAYIASSGWEKHGWKVGQNQVAYNFGVMWQFYEPVVFALVGAQLRVAELPANIVGYAAICIAAPAMIRFLFTLLMLCGSELNWKERLFVATSWMAKATVQAVLGPAALDLAKKFGDSQSDDLTQAKSVFIVSVLCILLTAPLGAVLIAVLGPRLLHKDETT